MENFDLLMVLILEYMENYPVVSILIMAVFGIGVFNILRFLIRWIIKKKA